MKSRIRRFEVGGVAALITVGALSSCTSTTEPVSAVRIVPASPTVVLRPLPHGLTLSTSVTLTNTSAVPIIWSNCSFVLERYIGIAALFPNEDAAWAEVWSPVCSLALSLVPPVPLQPGESVIVRVTAIANPQYPGTFSGEPGQYRVRLYLTANLAGQYAQLSREASTSDPFTVVAE